MKAAPATGGTPFPVQSERFHLWRSRKDRMVRWAIAGGGMAVIWAVVLIFFYLVWVVLPLFLPATTERLEQLELPRWQAADAVYLSVEEQREVGLRIASNGDLEFFAVGGGAPIEVQTPMLPEGFTPVVAADAVERHGLVAVAGATGQVLVFRHSYDTQFAGGVETRQIVPRLEFPYGESPVLELDGVAPQAVALSDSESALVIAALSAEGLLRVDVAGKTQNFLTGETTLEHEVRDVQLDFAATTLAVSGNQRWLYLGDGQGRIHRFALPGLVQDQSVQATAVAITQMTMLLGGISVLAGDADGGIAQLFPVRQADGGQILTEIRRFEGLGSAILLILPEERRKGFIALSEAGELGIYHSTAGRLVKRVPLADLAPLTLALAPRADGLLVEGQGGRLVQLAVHNEHPEISFSSLWRKVWYENYQEPEYVWQSSAATNEFEPKFSLTPLVFGTLKAALYAMLFAIPLALMGAAYTAYFMSPQLRKWVKPGIEIMAALPTVILGFLAGLWFAPWVEEHLADLFLMLLLIPPGLLLFAWGWHRFFASRERVVPEGWEPLLLLPALALLVLLAVGMAVPVQDLFFAGDLRSWLTNEMGIDYDQRNALVVGCAMGFAVIPSIFSIAEDAVFGVPKSLSDGSLALGATPWQTLVFVVLPTASPGIFSALMIGLGRAVGETMIVLMATGNTPVMDWNLFEGMRTLAANIAVEMPESEVNSSHYRILFLAALVLFLFTFVVNTGAEIVRQRLREKYSSL